MLTAKVAAEEITITLADRRVVSVTGDGVITVTGNSETYKLTLPSIDEASERCWQNRNHHEGDEREGVFSISAEHVHD